MMRPVSDEFTLLIKNFHHNNSNNHINNNNNSNITTIIPYRGTTHHREWSE